jgi:glyoxylase-like metal-dependent hydrolase (beta-lactamase superfamily II)
MSIRFDRSFDAPYGGVVAVSPLIRRVLANNPGPFTFKGTSTAIVGRGRVALIDPGPDDPAHITALKRTLAGETLTHIFVTHTHRDHSAAARALKQWSGAPTYGFGPHGRATPEGGIAVEEGGDGDFVPDIRLSDGEIVECSGFTIEAVHTPGHTSNHICYALADEYALFPGDHIMGWSTTVVAPPDGDMAQYIASLTKLLARNDRVYWPAHGGAIRDPKRFVATNLEHRREREAQILAVLRDGIATIPEMVARIYIGLDPRLRPAAGLSVLAHLVQLVREGRAIARPKPRLDARFSAV